MFCVADASKDKAHQNLRDATTPDLGSGLELTSDRRPAIDGHYCKLRVRSPPLW